jgi:membrane-associated protein
MQTFIDLFLHLDTLMPQVAAQYGPWIYGLLFLIIFAETGLVVTPILPGDSLLFAAGALAASIDPLTGAHILRVELVIGLLLVAAILGDAVNYSVGHYIGPRVFSAGDNAGGIYRLLNKNHLAQAHAFFEKYGGKAVVLGRWVPIVRTFVPFVAGAGSMTYRTFAFYNVVGAIIWVCGCVFAGYLFGNVPIVKENFSLVMLGIIVVSVLPAAYEFFKHRRGQK